MCWSKEYSVLRDVLAVGLDALLLHVYDLFGKLFNLDDRYLWRLRKRLLVLDISGQFCGDVLYGHVDDVSVWFWM